MVATKEQIHKERLKARKKRGGSKKHPKATVGIVTLTKEEKLRIRSTYSNVTLDFIPNGLGVGRPKAFETPESLRNAAKEYFEWSINNPLEKYDYRDGGIVGIPMKRVFTWSGFLIRQGASSAYFTNFRAGLKKDDPNTSEYLTIIDAISDVIQTQKFEGAASGFFNANLMSYDLGYKKDVAVAGASSPTVNINFGGVDEAYKDGLNELLAQLNAIDIEHKEVNNKPLNDVNSHP